MEGAGVWTANTFRNPRSSCIVVERGGAPEILDSLFAFVHAGEEAIQSAQSSYRAGVRLVGSRGRPAVPAPPTASSTDAALDLGGRSRSPSSSFLGSLHMADPADLAPIPTAVFTLPTSTDAMVGDAASSVRASPLLSSPAGSVRATTTAIAPSAKQTRRTRPIRSDPETVTSAVTALRAMTGVQPQQQSLLAPTAPAAEVEEEGQDDDEMHIPIRFELGGQGTLSRCVFVTNRPCSVLCDGATTAPLIEKCVFYRHERIAVAAGNGSNPSLRGCIFVQNRTAVHIGRSPLLLADCSFLSNTASVEADRGAMGMLSECRFLDDGTSVRLLPGTGFSVKRCVFTRCDTCVVSEVGAQGCLEDLRCLNTTYTAFVVESGATRPTPITRCRVFRGRGGLHVAAEANVLLNDSTFTAVGGTGVSLEDSAASSVSKCSFFGCTTGVLTAGIRCVAEVRQCMVQACRVGIEATEGSNPSAVDNDIHYNRVGVLVHREGLGLFKNLRVLGNGTGIALKSGIEGMPSVSNCSVMDSEEAGIHISQHAIGEVVGCNVFENKVNVLAAGSAATFFDHTKLSLPESRSTGEASMVHKESATVKLLIGPEVQQLYDHSPSFQQQTARQRRSEMNKAKAAHSATVDKTEHSTMKEERRARVEIQHLLESLGLEPSLGNIWPPPNPRELIDLNGEKKDAATGETPPSVRRSSTPRTPTREVRVHAGSGTVLSDPQDAGLNLLDRSGAASINEPPQGGGESHRSSSDAIGAENVLDRVLAAVRLGRRVAVGSTARGPVIASPLAGSLRGSMRHGKSVNVANRGEIERDNLIPSFQDELDALHTSRREEAPLLPPLPPPRTMRVYPRMPLCVPPPGTNELLPLTALPPLPPHPPGRVVHLCLCAPQNGKFNYGAVLHRDAMAVSKIFNPFFADQCLHAFSIADRRRAEHLTVLDFARFVEELCERYTFHPATYARLPSTTETTELPSMNAFDLCDDLHDGDAVQDQQKHRSASAARTSSSSASTTDGPFKSGPNEQQQDGDEDADGFGFCTEQDMITSAERPPLPSTKAEPPAPLSPLGVMKRMEGSTSPRGLKVGWAPVINSTVELPARVATPDTWAPGSMKRPASPLGHVARDFAETAWTQYLKKDALRDAMTLGEFARVVGREGTPMTPLFERHFTWLRRAVPPVPPPLTARSITSRNPPKRQPGANTARLPALVGAKQ